MSVVTNIQKIKSEIPANVQLIAVSKTKPNELILEAYNAGIKDFGENKVQELVSKHESLPQDIRWHMIGHLQTNKVKYIAPFVHLIHSVDSLKLLETISKEAIKNNRTIECLLQVYIASEETKFGLDEAEAMAIIDLIKQDKIKQISVIGLMGMASNTDNIDVIKNEFKQLKNLFDILSQIQHPQIHCKELSMGMSSDFHIAINEGSTMIRVGSTIFGERNIPNQ